MRAALLALASTVGLGVRWGHALLRAALAGAKGMVAGFVLFGALVFVVPKEWGGSVWNGGIFASGLVAAGLSLRDQLRQPASSDVMGSAAWATPRQLAATLATPVLAQDPAVLLVGRGYDASGRPRHLLRYSGPAHLLTIAPTRSGKGVGTVLPNLLVVDRSVLCIDPKGENARIAARARRRFGPVWVLDPFGASGQPAACFDPTAGLDPHSSDLADDAATLADALVHDPPGQAGEAHWNEEAKALITGLLMHLAGQRDPAGVGRREEGPYGPTQALASGAWARRQGWWAHGEASSDPHGATEAPALPHGRRKPPGARQGAAGSPSGPASGPQGLPSLRQPAYPAPARLAGPPPRHDGRHRLRRRPGQPRRRPPAWQGRPRGCRRALRRPAPHPLPR